VTLRASSSQKNDGSSVRGEKQKYLFFVLEIEIIERKRKKLKNLDPWDPTYFLHIPVAGSTSLLCIYFK
jgi:hypothetical protein